MFKKFAPLAFSFLALGASIPAHAEFDDSCFVEVAYANSGPQHYDFVAFNVVNDLGVSRSITLTSGGHSEIIDKLPCSTTNGYYISATPYSTSMNIIKEIPSVGLCQLKAYPVLLGLQVNSASVVFPDDFICSK